MKKTGKICLLSGLILFLLGVIFVLIAFSNPAASLPLPLWLTQVLYWIYLVVVAALLVGGSVLLLKGRKSK